MPATAGIAGGYAGDRPVVAAGWAARPIALVATGGYGRRELFPYSDIDLMFLCPDARVESSSRELIRSISQALWDTGLRASTITRSVRECDRFAAENFEFTLSLLDRRLVGGDPAPYTLVKQKVLPALIAREAETIQRLLQKSLFDRYARFGGTIFHLEPNVKEAPGGLRDHHAAQWCYGVKQDSRHKVMAEQRRSDARTRGAGSSRVHDGDALLSAPAHAP